jgi:D-sedoheptulose 7-phosphate isomerase
MHKTIIQNRIKESIEVKTSLLNDALLLAQIEVAVDQIIAVFKRGNKLLLCGNGGSAADAIHLAAEFSGRYYLDRKPLNAEALNVNVAAITAVSNDYGFSLLFARMLEAKAQKGDLLWLFSTSGNSENIINAANKAKEIGVKTIAFTGENGGKLNNICDVVVKIPSKDTPRIQEAHIMLGHIICELVENKLFGKEN